jgi:Tol biopolymer transport system component
MGEVYKAYDRTLERYVAIKILPLDQAPTEDALRRFTREAKAASSLNHPGIVTVYEIGQAAIGEDSIDYIAMELVDGETLRALIDRKLELTRALDYLRQICDALAKAHAAGLAHRDLKPENIMVTADGFAKVLDFGLAKSVQVAPVDNEGATAVQAQSITREGLVVGTVAYMSPEQVRGDAVDSRSDIFALGCILYEAATSRHPFRGSSAVETLHRIAYEPPPPITDAAAVTPELQRVIRKALAKDPDDRYQSAKEIAIDLREIRKEHESSSADRQIARAAVSPQRRSRSAFTLAAIAAVVIALIATAGWWVRSRRPTMDGSRMDTMAIERLPDTTNAEAAAISPDGRYVAAIERTPKGQAIFVRQMATGSKIVSAAADGEAFDDLRFSPDGDYIRFRHGGKLQQIPVLGGASRILLNKETGTASFSPDGKRVAYVRDGSLFLAAADGSEERRIAGGTSREFYVEPSWSPRGDVIACTRRSVLGTLAMWIEIIDPKSRDPVAEAAAHPAVIGGMHWFVMMSPAWLPDGSGLVVSGAQRPFAERQLWTIDYPGGQVHRITNDLFNYLGVSLSADGSQLVSLQTDKISRIWIAPLSSVDKAKLVVEGAGPVYSVDALSADSVVYSARSSGNIDIWSSRIEGGERRRLTDDKHDDVSPAVSYDGRTIAFVSDRSGQFAIWTMNSDGSNQKQISHSGWDHSPAFSPDGKWIAYTSRGQGKSVLWKIPADGGTAVPVSSELSRAAQFSPDGKFIAALDRVWNIGVMSAADGKTIRKFSGTPAGTSRWTKDSKSLLYESGNVALYRHRIDAPSAEKIFDFAPDELTDFNLTRDGASLLFARTSYQRSAVIIRKFR